MHAADKSSIQNYSVDANDDHVSNFHFTSRMYPNNLHLAGIYHRHGMDDPVRKLHDDYPVTTF